MGRRLWEVCASISTLFIVSLAISSCVGDDPAASTPADDGGGDGSAAPGDGAGANDASVLADGDVVDDPLCGAVASYWPGELAPADLSGKSTLSWRPNASNAAYTDGKFGLAFSLTTGALESQDFSGLATADAFAISLWWRTTEIYRPFVILEKGGVKSLSLESSNATFEVAFGTQKVSFPAQIVAATFAHLTLVLRRLASGSSVELYVNGAMVGSPKPLTNPVTPSAFPAGSLLTFGAPSFAGALDEITIFNRAVDQDEAKRLYENGLTCSGVLKRPVVDREALRCPPPPTTPVLLCGASDPPANCSGPSNPKKVCCTTGSCGSSAQCTASVGVVAMACATRSDCAAGEVCCATNIVQSEVSGLECTTLAKAPATACQASCAGLTQLCANTSECASGKCTGFKARVPSPLVSSASSYALGACVP